MRLLDTLLTIGPTIERESLYGSAYKRLAMIEAAEGNERGEVQAIKQMKVHYGEAEKIALKALEIDPAGSVNLYYPAMNHLAARIAAGEVGRTRSAIDPRLLQAIRKSMASAPADFYSVVGQTEVSVYASILAGTLAKDAKKLVAEFAEHHDRVSAPKMWGSVYDNAMFVLTKYGTRAGPAERKALDSLLSALARSAGQPAPGNSASKHKRASRTLAKPRKTRRK
jgi:hypothetical protein